MIKAYVRPSIPSDPEKVAPILRPQDKEEIEAVVGPDHVTALAYARESCALPLTMIDAQERPFGMFGVMSHPTCAGYGNIWLLSSDYLFEAKIPFIRQCKLWQSAIEEPYQLVGNVVLESNRQHVRWLRWLGYRFVGRHPELGLKKQPFLEFVRITKG